MSVSGTLSIIVAAVAVILGFLILRDISDNGDASGSGPDTGTTETTLAGGANNTDPANTTSTTPAAVAKPYFAVVANAAKVDGAAKDMTDKLTAAGVQTIPGITATGIDLPQAATIIYYTQTYELEAAAVATIMNVPATSVQPMPATPPGALGTANVLVQLGTDKANQPLSPVNSTVTTPASTPTT